MTFTGSFTKKEINMRKQAALVIVKIDITIFEKHIKMKKKLVLKNAC